MKTTELKIIVPYEDGPEEVFLPSLDINNKDDADRLSEEIAPELLERFGIDSPFNSGLWVWYRIKPQLPRLSGAENEEKIANFARFLVTFEAFRGWDLPETIAKKFEGIDPEYYGLDEDYCKRYRLHDLISGVARWKCLRAFRDAKSSKEWVDSLDAPGVWLAERIDAEIVKTIKLGVQKLGGILPAHKNFTRYVIQRSLDAASGEWLNSNFVASCWPFRDRGGLLVAEHDVAGLIAEAAHRFNVGYWRNEQNY